MAPPTFFSSSKLICTSGSYAVVDNNNQKDSPQASSETPASETSTQASSEKDYVWRRGNYESDVYQDSPWYTSVIVIFSYVVLVALSKLADWLRAHGFLKVQSATEHSKQKDFVSLNNNFGALYVNNLYRIASDVVNRPLAGVPGTIMRLRDRVTRDYGWTFEYTGKTSEVINMGSYNYLGFSRNSGPCAEAAAQYIDKYGIGMCGSRLEFGNHKIQRDMDRKIARFLGTEDAICFPMGFSTNSMNIPAFVGKECLILSDELNHASLALGSKLSGAVVKVFKHNDARDMEKKIVKAVQDGQPKTGKPFRKILIIIEGVYSMEGTIVNLPEFIAVKKRYKAYLFLDEAHSVGALGATGRGVVEYWGCDPHDVDVMMGTLTKSFAAAGGYIAGHKKTVDYIRVHSQGACYGTTMSPPIIAQVTASVKIMSGEDGSNLGREKTLRLLRNTRYLRRRLKQLGFLVYGHEDSPVVPIMTFFVTKVVCFGRETLKHNLGVVSVGYPATPLTKSRARLCVSAEHTKEQLDRALEIMNKVGDLTNTKYGEVDSSGTVVEY